MAKVTSWPPYQVHRLRDSLEELGEVVKAASDVDILPWLTRMLVVRSSGYIEQTCREVFWGYIAERSGGLVKTFGHSWLDKSRNPSPDSLLGMIGRFDLNLKNDFDGLLEMDDQRLRRELAYLVDRRNHIAHGLSEGINRDKALTLKDVSLEISDWFILKFNPMRV
ncbi:HEPN domain-containing protein [Duganella sp. SG902]|uniref:HEPN domain-containing protein n=1 Tax=Duganella sp. SG902 TaxID=2587016 RepID=UPI0035A6FF58